MAALISRAQIDSVKTTLGGVKSTAQALAALESTITGGRKLAQVLFDGGGAFRIQFMKDVNQYVDKLEPYRKTLAGTPTAPVGKTWDEAKAKIFATWMYIYLTHNNVPPDGDLGDGFGPAFSSALVDLPVNIGKAATVAVKAVVSIAKPIVQGAAEITGGAAWGLVKSAWPLLLIVGVGLVGYSVLKKKGIPLP